MCVWVWEGNVWLFFFIDPSPPAITANLLPGQRPPNPPTPTVWYHADAASCLALICSFGEQSLHKALPPGNLLSRVFGEVLNY